MGVIDMMHVALQEVQGIVNGKEILLTLTDSVGNFFSQCAVGLFSTFTL